MLMTPTSPRACSQQVSEGELGPPHMPDASDAGSSMLTAGDGGSLVNCRRYSCSFRPRIAAGAAFDTAEVSEAGSCKVESWTSSSRNRDFLAAVAHTCVVNMFRPLEVSAQFNRTRTEEEWSTSVSPKLNQHPAKRPRALG